MTRRAKGWCFLSSVGGHRTTLRKSERRTRWPSFSGNRGPPRRPALQDSVLLWAAAKVEILKLIAADCPRDCFAHAAFQGRVQATKAVTFIYHLSLFQRVLYTEVSLSASALIHLSVSRHSSHRTRSLDDCVHPVPRGLASPGMNAPRPTPLQYVR